MRKLAIVVAVVFVCARVLLAVDMSMPDIDKGQLMKQAEQKTESVGKAAVMAEKAGAAMEAKGQLVEEKGVELEKSGKASEGAKLKKAGKTMKAKGKATKKNSGMVSDAVGSPACGN